MEPNKIFWRQKSANPPPARRYSLKAKSFGEDYGICPGNDFEIWAVTSNTLYAKTPPPGIKAPFNWDIGGPRCSKFSPDSLSPIWEVILCHFILWEVMSQLHKGPVTPAPPPYDTTQYKGFEDRLRIV